LDLDLDLELDPDPDPGPSPALLPPPAMEPRSRPAWASLASTVLVSPAHLRCLPGRGASSSSRPPAFSAAPLSRSFRSEAARGGIVSLSLCLSLSLSLALSLFLLRSRCVCVSLRIRRLLPSMAILIMERGGSSESVSRAARAIPGWKHLIPNQVFSATGGARNIDRIMIYERV